MKKILYCLLLFLGLLLVPKEAEAAVTNNNGIITATGNYGTIENAINEVVQYCNTNSIAFPTKLHIETGGDISFYSYPSAYRFSELTIKTSADVLIETAGNFSIDTLNVEARRVLMNSDAASLLRVNVNKGDVLIQKGKISALYVYGGNVNIAGGYIDQLSIYDSPSVQIGAFNRVANESLSHTEVVGKCNTVDIYDTSGKETTPLQFLRRDYNKNSVRINVLSECVTSFKIHSYGSTALQASFYTTGRDHNYRYVDNGYAESELHEKRFPLGNGYKGYVISERGNFYDVECSWRGTALFKNKRTYTNLNGGFNSTELVNPSESSRTINVMGYDVPEKEYPEISLIDVSLEDVDSIRYIANIHDRVGKGVFSVPVIMTASGAQYPVTTATVQISNGYHYGGTFLESTYKTLVDNGAVDFRYTPKTWKDAIDFFTYWAPNSYTATWDLNDGTGRKTTTSCLYKQSYVYPDTVNGVNWSMPTRRGYKFLGWHISVSVANASSAIGSVYDFIGDRTLYAHWEHTQYKILFNDGHATAENPYIDGDYKLLHLDEAFGLLPTPIKTGYKFVGWFDAADGGKQYTASSVVGDNTPSTLQLYAHYEKLPEISTEEPDKDIQDGISEVKPNEDVAKELEEREAAEAAKRPESISQTIKLDQVKITSLKNVKRRKVILSYAKVDGATSYQIKFSPNRKLTVKKKDCKGTSKTFRKLRKGVKYYAQVRAICEYDDGTTVYGKWSKVKSIRIKR